MPIKKKKKAKKKVASKPTAKKKISQLLNGNRAFDKKAKTQINPFTDMKYQRANTEILTPATVQALSLMIENGATLSMAAAAINIRPGTFRIWLKRGKDITGWCSATGADPKIRFPEEPEAELLANLFARVDQARAKFAIKHLCFIGASKNRFGERDWRASAWLLERLGDGTLRKADVAAKQREFEETAAKTPAAVFILPDNARGPKEQAKDIDTSEQEPTELADHELLS